jgi:hypothetical protein
MRNKAVRVACLVAAAMVVAAVMVAPAGAQSSPSGWYTLAPGQYAEWDLNYPGNGNPTSNNTATVDVAEAPTASIGFKVYTDPQWQALAAGQTVAEVGDGTQSRGSNNTFLYNGDLLWQAGTPQGGIFHIQFYNGTTQFAQYSVTLIGVGSIYPISATIGPQTYYYAPPPTATPTPYYYGYPYGPYQPQTPPQQAQPPAPWYGGAYGPGYAPGYRTPYGWGYGRRWGWPRFWSPYWQ